MLYWRFVHGSVHVFAQAAQARTMSIGEDRHCCVTLKNGLPLYREKTVYIKTHKTAINRPVDHTGET